MHPPPPCAPLVSKKLHPTVIRALSAQARDIAMLTWNLCAAAGSSKANPFACIASGIAALWGPAHGGANEAVLQMLEKIGTKENIPAALARAKDKSANALCELVGCPQSLMIWLVS